MASAEPPLRRSDAHTGCSCSLCRSSSFLSPTCPWSVASCRVGLEWDYSEKGEGTRIASGVAARLECRDLRPCGRAHATQGRHNDSRHPPPWVQDCNSDYSGVYATRRGATAWDTGARALESTPPEARAQPQSADRREKLASHSRVAQCPHTTRHVTSAVETRIVTIQELLVHGANSPPALASTMLNATMLNTMGLSRASRDAAAGEEIG